MDKPKGKTKITRPISEMRFGDDRRAFVNMGMLDSLPPRPIKKLPEPTKG
jgi:hypothetical protein